jgi:hypothetical protein
MNGQRAPIKCTAGGCDAFDVGAVAVVMQAHVRTGLGKPNRGAGADPGTRTGNHRDSAS